MDRVRKINLGWNHRQQRAFCERTMSNLAAFWISNTASFTRGKWWHVVVVDVVASFFASHVFDELAARRGTECCHRNDLCGTAFEHCGTVRAREQVNFAPN